MSGTVVLQSHTDPLPHAWLGDCVDSVRRWAAANAFDYRWIGDELFDYVAADVITKCAHEPVIATDLARLKAIRKLLDGPYDTVVWCDADFLIFDPDRFALPDEAYALGREVWVAPHAADPGRFVAHVKVHNAFLMFRTGNVFLDFYADAAGRLLDAMRGPVPPQFIGPKLLTAIHNVVQCPVLETAAMFSPAVLAEIATTAGPALELFRRRSREAPAAANLCASLYARGETSGEAMRAGIARLLVGRALPES